MFLSSLMSRFKILIVYGQDDEGEQTNDPTKVECTHINRTK